MQAVAIGAVQQHPIPYLWVFQKIGFHLCTPCFGQAAVDEGLQIVFADRTILRGRIISPSAAPDMPVFHDSSQPLPCSE